MVLQTQLVLSLILANSGFMVLSEETKVHVDMFGVSESGNSYMLIVGNSKHKIDDCVMCLQMKMEYSFPELYIKSQTQKELLFAPMQLDFVFKR